MNLNDRLSFTIQLSTLLQSGTPLLKCLMIIRSTNNKSKKHWLDKVIQDIQRGLLLSQALRIASCGFDAQVNERANTYRGPAGTLKYLVALAVELIKLNSREFVVSTDGGGKITGRFTLIAVGNTSSYGGGLKMCPTADAFDQHFEVTYVDKVTRRLLVRVLPKVFWGGHTKHRQVTQSVAQKIEIGGDEFPVYADGEKIGHGPVVITLHPGAMRVWQAQPTNTP